MTLTLDYGRDGLSVALPDALVRHVLGLAPEPPLPDFPGAVAAALRAPLGTAPLASLAKEKRTACIVICDITRPVPNGPIVAAMLEELASAGIAPERVTVLVATGTHRPSTLAERQEMLGEDVLASGLTVVDHLCDDPETNRFIGHGPSGIAVSLDTRWLDAELRLTVGLIEPHFMAGFSGGRKLVMPGIAGLATIQAWHSPRFLEDAQARNLVLDGNPVHDENTAIAALCPADLICDVTLDEKRRVTGVFAGHWIDAWRAGVAFVARQVSPPIPAAVDIAVTCGGGYPLDATFYQVVKGIVGAYPIVRPGGTVIVAAQLSEGLGGPHFQHLLQSHSDLDALVAEMSLPDWVPVPDQWQVEMLAKATRERRVVVVCDNPERRAALSSCPVGVAATVEEALEAELARLGQDASIAVIPKGPYVIPEIRPCANGKGAAMLGES